MEETIIELKSLEIQNIISRYTKESFVCFFAHFIRRPISLNDTGFSAKLKNRLKDSLYLIMLRISSPIEGDEIFFISEENDLVLEYVADILLEITTYYLSENYGDFLHKIPNGREKLLIHELVFKNYFQNGILNYRTQELNKVIRLFRPYQEKIKERLGVSLETLIQICNYSEEFYKKKWHDVNSFTQDKDFENTLIDMVNKRMSNEEFSNKLPNFSQETQDKFNKFVETPHASLLFSKEDYYSAFKKEHVDFFCKSFSINISTKRNILFYSEPNPLENKPIIKLEDGTYMNVYQKQLPTALYNLLYKTLSVTNKEKEQLNHRRGKIVLENQTAEIFSDYFKRAKKLNCFRNYYINNIDEEKDILIEVNDIYFIIECKSSRNREPWRNTKQAYDRINSDFKECIQKGYDQCYQVEKELRRSSYVMIKTASGTKKLDISRLKNVFSIIVTSNRFACIQTNLDFLLIKQNENAPYPWSVCVDDLEVFFKTLSIDTINPVKRLSSFLKYRELLHKRVLTNDELDLCALFLKNFKKFKEVCKSNYSVIPDPKLQDYFDELFFEGVLSFEIADM